MRLTPLGIVLVCAFGALAGGCPGQRADDAPPTPTYSTAQSPKSDPNGAAVGASIADLARGKDAKDEDGQVAHDKAVSDLTAHGSAIELQIIDALRSNADWNVRLGCVEVLQSIGTKLCVDHLIACLQDREPLVALQANHTLEEMVKHKEIPDAGASAGANGLPPVPRRLPDQNEEDTELKLWTQWYNSYGTNLHDAWAQWWKAHGPGMRIE
jgi:hypothetical protein